MYCFAEHALTGAAEADRPTESDLMWLFGMIDFPIIVIYVLCYVAMGDWDKLVVDKIHDKLGQEWVSYTEARMKLGMEGRQA